jgi:hypothetical protein
VRVYCKHVYLKLENYYMNVTSLAYLRRLCRKVAICNLRRRRVFVYFLLGLFLKNEKECKFTN